MNTNPSVTTLPSMKYPRAFGNGVVLPSGQVLVVGGQYYALPFSDSTPSFPSELFDPVTNTWSTMASIAVPRNYHSVALLLPDATVLSAGGGICGLNSVNWYVNNLCSSPTHIDDVCYVYRTFLSM